MIYAGCGWPNAYVALVIELDGSQHFTPEQQEYDEKRTLFLNRKNLEVLRFTNTDMMKQTKAVLETIFNFVAGQKAQIPHLTT